MTYILHSVQLYLTIGSGNGIKSVKIIIVFTGVELYICFYVLLQSYSQLKVHLLIKCF